MMMTGVTINDWSLLAKLIRLLRHVPKKYFNVFTVNTALAVIYCMSAH